MCGIVGYLARRPGWIPEDFLEKGCAALNHRGPDDEGIARLHGGRVGLGMRRLSIIDLSGGHQPMATDDGRFTLVLNGEIYNYLELRERLLAKGHRFHTTSDTEVLLHAWQDEGAACLTSLVGMFAFAIWDAQRQELTVARDRFGEKPLYWHQDARGLVFASEIKALLAVPLLSRRIDARALDHYLTWLAVPDPDTMFEGIHKLPPAHMLVMGADGDPRIERYWQLRPRPDAEPLRFADAAERLLDLLQQSVRLRLRADVPVGVLLSGGVDSSAIVALAARETPHQLRTFSVGFDVPGFDEFVWSRAVAKQYDTAHTEVVMRADDYWARTEEAVYHLDEPMCDTAAVALLVICREARRSVKVVLSGEGSDEILAGYLQRYVDGAQTMGGLAWLSRRLPRRLREGVWRRFGHGTWPGSRRALWRATQPLEYQFLKASVYGYYEGLREPLYEGGPLQGYEPDERDLLHLLGNHGGTALQRMGYVDTVVNLPAYLLQKADKMSMAASVEARAPFLDPDLAEMCVSLPDAFRLDTQAGQGKALLKHALRGLLPDDLLYRPKMGFPVPIDAWLRGRLFQPVHDLLFDPEARIRRFLNVGHARNMWAAHQESRQIFGTQIWQLALLELWMRRFDVAPEVVRPDVPA